MLLFILLVCVDNLIWCGDTSAKMSPEWISLSYKYNKVSGFLILLPDLVVTTVSWFWIWYCVCFYQLFHFHSVLICLCFLCMHLYWVVLHLACFWHCLCLHHFFHPLLLYFIDHLYGSVWTYQSVHLVCLLLTSGRLLSPHFRDNLLPISSLALCVSSFLLLHILFWSFKDMVTFTIMIISSVSYCHPMHPWPTIFFLHHYSWQYR